MKKRRLIVNAALLAAIYVSLCAVLQPISFGTIQFRFSEMLCLLSIDYLWAFWGVVLGCLLSNLFIGGLGIVDVVFGTLATFIACLMAYLFRKIRYRNYPVLSAFVIALVNGVIIGIELGYILDTINLIPLYMLQVFIGEAVVLTIGLPIYKRLKETVFSTLENK